ncbi:alpha/beta-hydrolase family protein [Aldersonia kunmingensis]|uniref:alpha/beta-hydrolase family protein n=1 Tax=Aldersonia kunmingensis TaxID=408066 RepID=UPI000835421D|nr:alpha/beta-hydrolase family protein [Aldersonia kunmingensis]
MRAPSSAGYAVAAALFVASLSPTLLPRPALTQAVLSGVFLAIGWGLAVLLERPASPRPSTVVFAACVATCGVAVAVAHRWQNRLREAMRMAPIGAAHWVVVLLGAALVAAIVVGLAIGLRTVLRALGRRVAIVAVVVVVVGAAVLAPEFAQSRSTAYATANATIDPDVVPPAGHRSGVPGVSEVAWSSLGAHGRRFVDGGNPATVRVYVGVDTDAEPSSRAARAVHELERLGGLARSNVVVAIPTGSGWVDGDFTAGVESRFAGDVAIVAMQYSKAPSWASFLFGRKSAEAAAQALVDAVSARLQRIPHEERPRLHVYGQSLGAAAGSAALGSMEESRVCSVLWAGPPSRVPTRAAAVLANTSDPVVWWSPDLLIRAPDLGAARRDAPMPRWLPVLSFVQTSVDMLAALEVPRGHGHRYGSDQGAGLGDCSGHR